MRAEIEAAAEAIRELLALLEEAPLTGKMQSGASMN